MALGGGGYEVVDVVPRAWTHLVGDRGARGRSARPTAVPAGLARARPGARSADPGPATMSDGREVDAELARPGRAGYDPDDPVDRAVMATREAVFPLHGLDPWFD